MPLIVPNFYMYCTLCGFVADYLMICSIISEPGGGSSCSKNEQSQCIRKSIFFVMTTFLVVSFHVLSVSALNGAKDDSPGVLCWYSYQLEVGKAHRWRNTSLLKGVYLCIICIIDERALYWNSYNNYICSAFYQTQFALWSDLYVL